MPQYSRIYFISRTNASGHLINSAVTMYRFVFPKKLPTGIPFHSNLLSEPCYTLQLDHSLEINFTVSYERIRLLVFILNFFNGDL